MQFKGGNMDWNEMSNTAIIKELGRRIKGYRFSPVVLLKLKGKTPKRIRTSKRVDN